MKDTFRHTLEYAATALEASADNGDQYCAAQIREYLAVALAEITSEQAWAEADDRLLNGTIPDGLRASFVAGVEWADSLRTPAALTRTQWGMRAPTGVILTFIADGTEAATRDYVARRNEYEKGPEAVVVRREIGEWIEDTDE